MKTRIFYGGWVLTLLATFAVVCINKEANIWPGTVFCVGLFALSTYCLSRNIDFPYRSEALANSWIGPFLLATSEIVFSFYSHRLLQHASSPSIPPLATSILELKHTMLALILLAFFSACVEALFVAWLFFRYGIIQIMALIAEIPVIGKRRQNWTKSIGKLPPHWGWIFVIVIFLLRLLPAIFIAWVFLDVLHTLA
jgi:hypothetical protein